MTTLIFLAPVASGLLLLWVMRKDRRRHFVQQRLFALAGGLRADAEPVSQLLRRKVRETVSLEFLPESMRTPLRGALEAAGNRINVLHLLIVALIAAFVV